MTTRADQIKFCDMWATDTAQDSESCEMFRAIAATLRSSTPAPLASPDAGTTSGGHPSVPNGEDSGRKRRQNIDAMPELTRYPYDHPKVLYRTVCLASEVDAMVATLRADREAAPAPPDLLIAAKAALAEMIRTVAPRNSFTDAVDLLDAAITNAEAARPGVAVAPQREEQQ